MTLALLLLVLVAGCLPARAAEPVPIGVTPGSLSHWQSQWVFVNQFKHSLPWRSSQKGTPLRLNEHGWVTELQPGQEAWSLVHTRCAPHYPPGPWVCLYEGQGKLRFEQAASVQEARPGRIVLAIDRGQGGVKIVLEDTDPQDPLRGIRLIPREFIGSYEQEPIHPRFLELLAGFDVIRFTNLMRSAHRKHEPAWETRVTPAHQTQAGPDGMALEHAIQLCEATGAAPWFTMPVNGDGEYFRHFARFLKEHLPEDRRVYVEYGDDVGVWPTASSQYCIEQGLEEGLSDDHRVARSRYYAKRSAELFAIWEEVFEGDDRLLTVLNPIDEEACTYADAAQGADLAGLVTLFGSEFGKLRNVDHLLKTDLNVLMDELEQVAVVNEDVRDGIARARRFGLEPVSFYMTPIICALGPIEQERGEDVHQKVVEKTLAMNLHPRMEPIFRQYIQSWREAGGGTCIHTGLVHKPTQWGWFGLLRHMYEKPEESAKFRAVRSFMDRETD